MVYGILYTVYGIGLVDPYSVRRRIRLLGSYFWEEYEHWQYLPLTTSISFSSIRTISTLTQIHQPLSHNKNKYKIELTLLNVLF